MCSTARRVDSLSAAKPEMTSSWLTGACAVLVVVSAWVVVAESSAVADDSRASSLIRLITRLCDAISVNNDDVIDDRKRKWGDNTMMAWGKREEGLGVLYARSICESLERNRRLWREHFLSETGNKFAVDNEATKRRWAENTMETWGKRK